MPEERRTEELAAEFLDDATAVPGRPSRETSDAPIPPAGPGLLARMSGMALAVLIGIAGAVLVLTWLLGRSMASLNPFEESTIDRSGQSVLVTLTDLKTFQAASGYYEIVIDQETDVENVPAILAGERVIFVAAGTVDASVDFASIGEGNVTVNADRTEATIELPAPQLGKAQIDLDRSYVAGHQRGLKQRIQDAIDKSGGGVNTEQLYRTAELRLTEAGTRTGELKERAHCFARAMLTSLLGSLNCKVTVTFADE